MRLKLFQICKAGSYGWGGEARRGRERGWWGQPTAGRRLLGNRSHTTRVEAGQRAIFVFLSPFFLKENEAQMAERNAGDHWHNDLPVVG